MGLRSFVNCQAVAFETERATFSMKLAELRSSLEDKDHKLVDLNGTVVEVKGLNKWSADRVCAVFFLLF